MKPCFVFLAENWDEWEGNYDENAEDEQQGDGTFGKYIKIVALSFHKMFIISNMLLLIKKFYIRRPQPP